MKRNEESMPTDHIAQARTVDEALEGVGFRRFDTRALGSSYSNAHVETLLELYIDATLHEREGQK